jgi:hypothetical protein
VKEIVGKDFVDTKIDTDRMTHGAEVAKKLRGESGGGIPWIVILDATGKQLVTSDGPKGNVGCPVQPEEVAWFMSMVKQTRQRITDEDFTALGEHLETFARKYRR